MGTQVADILDEQQLKVLPISQMCRHHARIQVTRAARRNLPHGITVFEQPLGVVIGLDVTRQPAWDKEAISAFLQAALFCPNPEN